MLSMLDGSMSRAPFRCHLSMAFCVQGLHPLQERVVSLAFDLLAAILETGPVRARRRSREKGCCRVWRKHWDGVGREDRLS